MWAIYAALFEDGIDRLSLVDLPKRNRDAPDLLNVTRFVEMPDVVSMAAGRVAEMKLTPEWEEVLFQSR
jgi:hypothetical protein